MVKFNLKEYQEAILDLDKAIYINPNFELNMKIFEQTGFSPKTITNDDYQVI